MMVDLPVNMNGKPFGSFLKYNLSRTSKHLLVPLSFSIVYHAVAAFFVGL